MTDGDPCVLTMEPGVPFLKTLAARLLESPDLRGGTESSGALALCDLTVLLPTRRAVRALESAFIEAAGGSLLLPSIMALGDVEDDDAPTPGTDETETAIGDAEPLLPAVTALERQCILTRLVHQWAQTSGATSADPAHAAMLAGELARFLDAMSLGEAALSALPGLVPEDYAENWGLTLAFLNIVTRSWPEILAERRRMDPAERRVRALRGWARRWRKTPPGPVVAAGSTGSIPATAALLTVIARLPLGAVVLPGLDTDLDEAAWRQIGPDHPQYAMKHLLEEMNVPRQLVRRFPGAPDAPDAGEALRRRHRLLNEALRPAAATAAWRESLVRREGAAGGDPAEALLDVARIDAPTPREEASAIAVLLRECIETPGRVGALVTPDRSLARRVAGELRRWNLEIDDSAGMAVTEAPSFVFLQLLSEAVSEEMAPVALLALLKHPLTALGYAPARSHALACRLERLVLRGVRPAPGIDGLRRALATLPEDLHAVRLREFLDRLERATADLCRLFEGEAAAADLVRAHWAAAEALAADNAQPGANRLWRGEAGRAVFSFMEKLTSAAADLPPLEGRRLGALLTSMAAGRVIHPAVRHPRLFIWGQLEARLQHADLMILGGLNEGVWPTLPTAGPWLNRAMQAALGLEAPEQRIGLSAHDFIACASAPQVVLTRSLKSAGTPTTPSRWLSRLDAVLAGGEGGMEEKTAALRWSRMLDEAPHHPVAPPTPTPPVAVRPKRLSVTQIETLIRDPYAVYARHILSLKPLEPLDADPGAAERGILIHRALHLFATRWPKALPDDIHGELMKAGRAVFDRDAPDRPGVEAFWWPRFVSAARWFAGFERDARHAGGRVLAEISGKITVDAGGQAHEITARADRIDLAADGSVRIYDYKTGQAPSIRQVAAGLSPQLTLEAAIAVGGGFADVAAAARVDRLAYILLTGGSAAGERPAGAAREIRAKKDGTVIAANDLAARAHKGLARLLASYADPKTAYLSRPRPQFIARAGDYDHLARVLEWSTGGVAESDA